jgi:membrane-bound lytic murein transglycosylase F
LIRKFVIPFVLLIIVLPSCSYFHPVLKSSDVNCASIDLDSIKKRGHLIAVTDINSTDYFIYKGEPMGFNYELLKSFSDQVGVDLEIVTENNFGKASEMLKRGDADLLTLGFSIDSTRMKDILLTSPIMQTRQVLVQRKPVNWRTMTKYETEKHLVRSQIDLAKKTVYIQEGSYHFERMFSHADKLADSVNVVEVPYESEKLIQHVAKGEIDYTVCNENLALVNSTYFPEIDVSTTVSTSGDIAWGVRRNNSDTLISELNRWITAYKKTGSYALLYAKYFKNSWSNIIVKSDFYAINTGKVSGYDDIIRKSSVDINWDWRLLASLICQESHFNPDVKSGSGAYGLMQIMPGTGTNFGIDITSSPENNIRAGILYINWLHSIFDPKITDQKERLNFILAAYNAGPGHVLDAMKLAEKNGMDPLKWDGNVAVWLLKKSQPKYFNDSVVKNGYFNGKESVAFVAEVLNRYEHYKNILPSDKIK